MPEKPLPKVVFTGGVGSIELVPLLAARAHPGFIWEAEPGVFFGRLDAWFFDMFAKDAGSLLFALPDL